MATLTKNKAVPTAPKAPEVEPDLPIVHTLTILAIDSSYQLIRLVTKGSKVLGMVREGPKLDAKYLAYMDFKHKSVKYFEDKHIFDAPVPEQLEPLPVGSLTAVGIVRVNTTRFLPVSLRVSESGDTVSATPLYSAPIYISDAFSLYKVRAEAVFVQNKHFLE